MVHTPMSLRDAGGNSMEDATAACDGSDSSADLPDALSREVCCILGVPIDLVTMPAVVRRLETAAFCGKPFMFSTPNLNFLVISQSDSEFRETLLLSDLCPPDGAPILWIARLLGVPIRHRIAGSDIFDALKSISTPLKLFFFGGAEGVATAAASALNDGPGRLRCVGTFNPGFCSLDEMSSSGIIDQVNSSSAEFLVASLGARKGQLWLQRNFNRIRIPIRAHLGAALNFEAGTVKRAPTAMRKWGLEWLWRIKEEPHLFTRYLNDGAILLRLLFTSIVPLAVLSWLRRYNPQMQQQNFSIVQTHDDDCLTLFFLGSAVARHVRRVIPVLREAITSDKELRIDLSALHDIDARFLGLLLMLRKTLKGHGRDLVLTGLSPGLARVFRLNGVKYLLSDTIGSTVG
jgi:N-acetylglucosaminyldiphosphoundecaprenol N-acetyl-beta-D-mannosaminyltransferase